MFIDEVVPELQRRGVFRSEYVEGTLRDNLGLPYAESSLAKSPATHGPAFVDMRDLSVPVFGPSGNVTSAFNCRYFERLKTATADEETTLGELRRLATNASIA